VTDPYNPSSWKAEGRSRVQGQPGLYGERLISKKRRKKKGKTDRGCALEDTKVILKSCYLNFKINYVEG
jgi:hypothetical protein